MQEFKLIVAGGRDFNDYPLACEEITRLADNELKHLAVSLVSGMAQGADALGTRFARANNIKLYEFPADWTKHGKGAGFIRNAEMAQFADGLLAFWDGQSHGTKHMIETMQKLGKSTRVIRYGEIQLVKPMEEVTWRRNGPGYECSSKGDKRFSALWALMPDGRTIEQHYQCDVKGYEPGGRNWKLGKGKPPIDTTKDLWGEYLKLWQTWAANNPGLIAELSSKVPQYKFTLTDCFASTPVNQAHALAHILNHL